MKASNGSNTHRFSTVLIVSIVIVGLLAGGLLGYVVTYSALSGRISDLQNQVSALPNQNVTYVLGTNTSLSQLYNQVKDSVVVIEGQVLEYNVFHQAYYSQVQGSGFVYNYSGRIVVITNYHVVQGAINVTITFSDGDTYAATVLGHDPYEDLAVLSAAAPQSEWKPIELTHSSTLEVGDPVIAVGSPYGYAGSMTTGIVSALGRTLTETMTGGYPIASVIQTSTPINPGNSGGPLLDYEGRVVGITTAIVTDSQGLGFAIPSNAILREVGSLVTTGSYNEHPSLGVSGIDMTYAIAKAMGTNVTYGWLVVSAPNSTGLKGGTTQVLVSGSLMTIGGDIIISINGVRIKNIDDLSTYLEENALPGQAVSVTVIRDNQKISVPVTLGTRPSA